VYVDGTLRPGIAIRETIIRKPLYFGQKDLSAAGKGFGHDLVEKLVGDGLIAIRKSISEAASALQTAVEDLEGAELARRRGAPARREAARHSRAGRDKSRQSATRKTPGS
jgi:hypothetical protein